VVSTSRVPQTFPNILRPQCRTTRISPRHYRRPNTTMIFLFTIVQVAITQSPRRTIQDKLDQNIRKYNLSRAKDLVRIRTFQPRRKMNIFSWRTRLSGTMICETLGFDIAWAGFIAMCRNLHYLSDVVSRCIGRELVELALGASSHPGKIRLHYRHGKNAARICSEVAVIQWTRSEDSECRVSCDHGDR
jgi:hypothetical protein